MKTIKTLLAGTAICAASAASAVDLEVTHWWTSGGEAAAVAEFAKALNEKTDHNWVDGAIAGSGGTARPIIISRIIGGEPMGATQLNHGRQAEELIEAGLLLDLTDVAEAEPELLKGPRDGETADDLKRISGVGPKLEGVLNDLGFYHFDQIAKWGPGEVAWVDARLKFKGRITRDDWIGQAKAIAAEKD